MTKRQPKGTPVGGQFAPERKPGGGDLTVDRCSKCGGEIRALPLYDPTDRANPFPPGVVRVCTNCGDRPTVNGGTATNLELADRLNSAHVAWQEFDDGEQLSKSDFNEIYGTLDDAIARLRGDDNDPASASATDLELAEQLDDARHMIYNFDEDGIPLSRDDVDLIYGALEGARERLGVGGPHGDDTHTNYCVTCGIYTDSAETVCVDCGNEMVSATPDSEKERITNIIFNEFATPDGSPISAMPNDTGTELLAHSSLDISYEGTADEGFPWSGVLTMNGTDFDVYNAGHGTANRYVAPARPAAERNDFSKTMNDLVLRGFPGLSGESALDVFCSLVQIVQENTP